MWRAGALAVALLGASCVTTEQVKGIVDDSNLAMMSAELDPAAGGVQAGGTVADWKAVSKRMEAFIAANPDQKATVAALRVRQAMMLLQAGQANLAAAAFAEADGAQLFFPRDRALKRLQNELVWWYRVSAGTFSAAQLREASDALAAFARVDAEVLAPKDAKPEDVAASGGIRDLLATIRACIGLKAANETYGAEAARPLLEDAINTYAATLPAGETERWARADAQAAEAGKAAWPPEGVTIDVAVGTATRRRFHAEYLIANARQIAAAKGIAGATYRDGYFAKRLAP